MRRSFAVTVLGLALVVGLGACKKTQEGENKAWERNAQRARELSALYPGFAPAIQVQQQKAQAAMEAARTVPGAEESAKRMAEANGMLSGGFVGSLGQMDGRVKQLREKLVSASSAVASGPDAAAAQPVLAEAQRVLAVTADTLRRGSADPVGAAAILRKTEGDLADAGKGLDQLIAAAKKRQEAAATPAAGAPASAAGAAASAAPAAATWKCAYCGRVQEGAGGKCAGCGAPRKVAAR